MLDCTKSTYSEKIIKLLDHHGNQGKLSDYLEVNRNSLMKWKEDDSKLKNEDKLKIDIAYCEAFGFEQIDTNKLKELDDELGKINFSYFSASHKSTVQNISRLSAFGSLEIEEDNISENKFNKVISGDLIENIDQREVSLIKNISTLSDRIINQAIEKNIDNIDTEMIKDWHFHLMTDIRDDAGSYSDKYRIIPGSEELTLTDPRDIPEEMENWADKYKEIKTLIDIAKAHAHFESIHPFGDGNGRMGRLIIAAHSIIAGYIPPLINKQNKALYLVFLKHAQVRSEYDYLAYFIGRSILEMHTKFFKRKSI